MDRNLQIWFMVLVVVTTLSVAMQVAARVERISECVEHGVVRPLREAQAISAAPRAALSVFFRRGSATETR
ncbi:MAG TPA: hypothetical protein VKM93_19220 [Terriglobia bacterium]|nr:hypothetical protein [Terriglobia bacterium]